MQIRRLEQWEHEKTRRLYETVFCEDTPEFMDYYYNWKIRDNIIFVAEDEEGIHAMLHLNPFQVYVNGRVEKLHYIVAVATQEEYRHRGLMRRLLAAAEQEMAENGEAFTFLMPASEKIYSPFGYRYFAMQQRWIRQKRSIREKENKEVTQLFYQSEQYEIRSVKAGELQKLADFVNQTLMRQYDLFVYRDAAYYERLCAEQRSQNGSVMVVVKKDGAESEKFVGSFCTACEAELTVREVILELPFRSPLAHEVFLRRMHENPEDSACETVTKELLLHSTKHAAGNSNISEPGELENAGKVFAEFCSLYKVRKVEGSNYPLALDNTAAESGELPEWEAADLPLLMGKCLSERKTDGCLLQMPDNTGIWNARVFINEVV